MEICTYIYEEQFAAELIRKCVEPPPPPPCQAVGLSRLSWNGANSFPWKPTSYNSVHFGL